MRAFLLCLCVCLSLISCKKEDQGVFIRVRNASQYPLEKIRVNSHEYGALGVGQSSDYQPFSKAGGLPSVTLTAQGEDLASIAINDMPSNDLDPGNYTYVVDVIKGNNGQNQIWTVREKP
jgi:hypothetical protein